MNRNPDKISQAIEFSQKAALLQKALKSNNFVWAKQIEAELKEILKKDGT